ncbi:adenylate/guanylate cyclase domain-containing protein [Rodentibacter haemolyticus]|uniref:Adenylate cyclase n=1 Tax=Rodentibacter haemolyticus TaxID=2778911 RepID=A0ABX6V285_9PAST|nr:adenylate/guanylate cyclase domain-containing protein [Rodentibacter haemolyticus]QPB42426.1 adenylate cyclase [Rodentibacter haemolyticus]
MSEYDYKQGKNRVETILNNYMQVEEKDKLPCDDNFTFENGYLSWVTAIFVDIRDSTSLFTNYNKEIVAKLIRSFTSEVIEILRDDNMIRDIGIRGDCVYAIYTTPYEDDVLECANKTFYVNTFINMFNKLLSQKGFPTIKVGIGMATDKELVVKTGRKGVGINDKVWIGRAVTMASNLSGIGEKDSDHRLIYSSLSYDNFLNKLKKRNVEAIRWFKQDYYGFNKIFKANIIISEFNNWIESDFS